MNTPDRHDDELRCAEYVLGVLDTDERRELERDASGNPALMSRLEFWQEHFSALTEDLPPETPPDRVWQRIAQVVAPVETKPSVREKSASLWDNLQLWRWLGVGASVAALVLLAITLRPFWLQPEAVRSASTSYWVATIARPDGIAHWTATIAPGADQLIIVPADRPSIAQGRATELWLIQGEAKPVPLGVFDPEHPATIALSREVAVALRRAAATLAVSIEPPGGAPSGQPTGPVIATGSLRPA